MKRKNAENKTQDVVQIVENILKKAVEAGASDIHFEPTESELVIKYRLDGVLTKIESLPKLLCDNVIARLKVLANLLTYRNDIPQEGRIEINDIANNVLDQRLAVFPTINGQRAVVRIFYQQKNLTELAKLGFADEIQKTLKNIASKNQGLLLLTGPAGSGKSTTLAAMLRFIQENTPGRSVITIEDPVEIRISGITQTQITPFGQMTFATALRSLLRQDPQVIMLGEIRDAETAKIAIEAALTGHLLMSTMHCVSPAAGFLRLLEMGIEPYQISSSICAILNQRLVRRLCQKCKNKSGGCEHCLNTGYKGRAMIAELAEMNSPLRKAIAQKADIETLDEILSRQNHQNIFADGKRLVEKGITDTNELDRVLGKVE